MTRDEWHQVLATEPATPDQLGAVMGEFRRLGFDHQADRAERLAACAALLGLDGLDSIRDLVMGQAGQLVHALREVTDRAELETMTGAVPPGEQAAAAAEAPRVSLRDLVAALAVLLADPSMRGSGRLGIW